MSRQPGALDNLHILSLVQKAHLDKIVVYNTYAHNYYSLSDISPLREKFRVVNVINGKDDKYLSIQSIHPEHHHMTIYEYVVDNENTHPLISALPYDSWI